MLTSDESAERRALQHALYAPGGSLTADQRARLVDLEQKSRPGRREETARVEEEIAQTRETVVEEPVADEAGDLHPSPQVAVHPDMSAQKGGFLSTLRTQTWWRKPRVIVAGLVALVLAGFAVGAAIPKEVNVALPMSAEQAERRVQVLNELEDYDRSSFILIAKTADGLLWYGTRMGGDLSCAVLDLGAEVTPMCVRSETADLTGIHVQSDMGSAEVVDYYYGSVFFTYEGVPLARLDYQSNMTFRSGMQFTPEQEVTMRSLVDDGYAEGTPEILGYLDGQPIWAAYASDWGSPCLIFDDPEHGRLSACVEESQSLTAPAPSSQLGVPDHNLNRITAILVPATADRDAVRIELASHTFGGRYLNVTHSAEGDASSWSPWLK